MTEVVRKKDEKIESLLKRFSRKCMKHGTLSEYKRKAYYEKPSVSRQRKINDFKRKKRT